MKIVPILFKYDYGKKERGVSLERLVILPALEKNADIVSPFWLEDNGYPTDKKGLQIKILDFVDKENPDFVFFQLMRDEVTPKTIEILSKRYITINWFCDDQWRFETFTRFVAPKLTFSITVDKYSIKKYEKIGCHDVILSQWAAPEYVEKINFNSLEYKYDISFIGGKNATREYYINTLIKLGYNVVCFGHGWDNGSVSYEQMKEIFLHSRINLNLSNSFSYDKRVQKFIRNQLKKSLFKIKTLFSLEKLKRIKHYFSYHKTIKNVEQIKMRNFEIPACGGFQLTHYALSIEDFFLIGKEIAVFSNIDELARQVDFYLNNDEEREKIKIAGYKRAKEYTFEKKFEEIFKNLR